MTTKFELGDWSFCPSTATLLRADGEQRRLESRAAHVLALLCERGGGVVSHKELVEKVWDGRELSRNSVAVVIGDLRRALDDDARSPRFIETIPKRGYRLLAQSLTQVPDAAPSHVSWRTPSRALAISAGLIAVLGIGVLTQQIATARPTASVTVSAFANETSRDEYDSLSVSITQLISTNLARRRGVEVLASGAPSADIRMRGTLALWEGAPAVYLFAEDPHDGRVIWSGVAPGPEAALPDQIDEQLGQFVTDLQHENAR